MAGEKWKRGFSKIISGNKSKDSTISSISGEPDGNISNEMEVEAYFQRLKSKTSMKNLWTGKKFEDIVEDDQTPDISTESDEELDFKLSNTMKNLRQIRLDSDEDEMRIDYIRENTLDENNNKMADSSDESLHLLDNLHFTELEINEVDLSDKLKEEKANDFLPILYSTEFGDIAASDSKSFDSDNYGGLSKLESLEGSVVKYISKSFDEEIEKSDSITVNDVDVLSEIQSITSSYSESVSKRSSKSSSTSRHSKTISSSKSDSKKYSTHSKSSRSSKRSCSSAASERTSTASDVKDLASEDLLSDTITSVSHGGKTLSSRSQNEKSSQKSSLKSALSESKKSREKRSCERKDSDPHNYKDVDTQTKRWRNKRWRNNDKTEDVLNFRYDWQRRDPSNIAAHVIDPVTIDVLTSYNPSVLAANDLMKFHMQLLQQHIQDSRRLYESYANENLNNNYQYTTVEDTKKYIEKNRPKVISYEEALRKAKKE